MSGRAVTFVCVTATKVQYVLVVVVVNRMACVAQSYAPVPEVNIKLLRPFMGTVVVKMIILLLGNNYSSGICK